MPQAKVVLEKGCSVYYEGVKFLLNDDTIVIGDFENEDQKEPEKKEESKNKPDLSNNQ